jgi:hypothetical protein
MDASGIPTIVFTANDPFANTLVVNEAASSWINETTYRAAYSVTDSGEELSAINLEVSGVTDANGNAQIATGSVTNAFTIDTRNPLVVSMTPSTTTLQTTDVGTATFEVAITFDEAMDESSQPAVLFVSTPVMNVVTSPASAWSSATEYTLVYDIPNQTQQITTVDMTLDGNARDVAGNAAVTFNASNAFSVNIVNSIETTESLKTVSIYPNPTSGNESITLQLPANQTIASIAIYSSVGQLIQELTYTPNDGGQQLNVSQLSNGVYYLRLRSLETELTLPFNVIH